jgi:hypothetical protein
MKVHCAELVQGALRSALSPQSTEQENKPPAKLGNELSPTLQDSLSEGQSKSDGKLKIRFLEEED